LTQIEPLEIDKQLEAAELFGKLKEGVYIAGHELERALSTLEWMLEDDRRWRSLGHQTVNDFLDSINFDKELRLAAETRKKIAKRIKELQPEASNRKIAKVTGVNPSTIDRDLAANAAADAQKTQDNQSTTAANAAPQLSGSDTAKLAARHQAARLRQVRDDARQQALYSASEIAPGISLHVGDFRELSPQVIPDESVQLVFTDPPYERESIPLYGAAAREATRILKPGGSMLCYCGHFALRDALNSMAEHLDFYWVCSSLSIEGAHSQIIRKGIEAMWKPMLWFVKDHRGDPQTFVRDVVSGTREKSTHEWQQSLLDAEYYLEKLTSKDGTVVDFFVGGGTALVAAKRLGCRAIGFEIDPETAAKAKERLDAERLVT
jgi:16S rRNA G966 N2-methylase RsmD